MSAPISISLMLAFYGLISLLWKEPIYITKYEFNYCKLHQLNNCLHVNESSHYRPCPKSFIITWKYHMQSFHLLWLLSFLCCIWYVNCVNPMACFTNILVTKQGLFFLFSLLWNPFKTLFISKLLYFVVSECIGATQKTIVNQGQYISG